MGETAKILAWGMVAAIVGVVFFVRAPEKSGGLSGGAQASMIINSVAGGAAKVVNAAEGYEIG